MTYFQKLLILAVITLAFGGFTPVSPKALMKEGKAITEKDKLEIQQVIREQIEAFLRDDGEAAFSLAAPGIQQKFVTADIFLKMVKDYYMPVYRPQQYDFLTLEFKNGLPVQLLEVIGPDGWVYKAFYPMEFQPNQTWKTAGCYLIRTRERRQQAI